MGDRGESGNIMANAVTFHTNGEDSSLVHTWEEAARALERGESLATTQLDLLDSYWVRHRYDQVVIADEGREIVIVPSEQGWRTDATDRRLRKFHRLLHLWQNGEFDDGEARPTRGQALRKASVSPTDRGAPGIASEGRRTVTFHVDSTGDWAIHGWLSGCVLLEVGMSFATTQVALLDDWRIGECYDEVVIQSRRGAMTFLSDGNYWRTSATERRLLKTNSLLHLWKAGEFSYA